MSQDDIPQADQVPGAPHPRQTLDLFGHAAAEAEFLAAHAGGRLHHAWLLTGVRGIGKATLAWRMARFLAASQGQDGGGLFGDAAPVDLRMSADDPVYRRTLALSEPRIALCRRGWDDKAKRLKTQLTVDEVRKLKSHFTLSVADGGWRAAIIDAADEMNVPAANALLKLLEEPPAKTVLILVCHQPARLLPTIRSRCRVLRLNPLSEEDLGRALHAAGMPLDDIGTLHKLAGGSVGDAIRLATLDGLEIYPRLVALLSAAPRLDRTEMAALGAMAAGRDSADRYAALTELWLLILARIARTGAGGHHADLLSEEVALAARLAPGPAAARAYAELHQDLTARISHARAVNLDPELVILDMFTATEKTASRVLATHA